MSAPLSQDQLTAIKSLLAKHGLNVTKARESKSARAYPSWVDSELAKLRPLKFQTPAGRAYKAHRTKLLKLRKRLSPAYQAYLNGGS